MISVLMVLFVILCFLLGVSILIQQGKGDMGLGSMGAGSQMLFGGSGGQDFFERMTWTFGFLFMFGALGLAILKSRSVAESKLASFRSSKVIARTPEKATPATDTTAQNEETEAAE